MRLLRSTHERVQIVDSGLDETMCFFADEDGGHVEHGYMFTGVQTLAFGILAPVAGHFFPYDLSRRKVRCQHDICSNHYNRCGRMILLRCSLQAKVGA